jgi:hypothetical protein
VASNGREKRNAPRADVLGHALIVSPRGKAHCVIRDLSATGAKLAVSRRLKLPQEFDLYLVQAKSTRRVIVRWREGDFAGVEFLRGERTRPSEENRERWFV